MVAVTPSVVAAVFKNRTDARHAVGILGTTAGFRRDCISLVVPDLSPDHAGSRSDCPAGLDAKDVASRGFVSGSDPLCAEVLRRGDAVVLVRVDSGTAATFASGVLERCGAVDIDAR